MNRRRLLSHSALLFGGTFAFGSLPNFDRTRRIRGQLLEGCSCGIPCACNFGGEAGPQRLCESLAFLEIETGKLGRVDLRGLQFATAVRGGENAVLFVNNSSSEMQEKAVYTIVKWILSLEGTPLVRALRSQVEVDFDLMQGSVFGPQTAIFSAVPLLGTDGKAIRVSYPWIFGSFPVVYVTKGVTKLIKVSTDLFSFSHQRTNSNSGVFDFSSDSVA